jgi:hypothetical protein
MHFTVYLHLLIRIVRVQSLHCFSVSKLSTHVSTVYTRTFILCRVRCTVILNSRKMLNYGTEMVADVEVFWFYFIELKHGNFWITIFTITRWSVSHY